MSVIPFPSPRPLGEAARELAATLAPHFAPDPLWREHISTLIRPLREAFAEHCVETEGELGIYAGLVDDAPRLAHAVDGLVAEHRTLHTAMSWLARATERTDVDNPALRQVALKMLGDLDRHRRRDADLVYEAYSTDIGGE